MTNLRVWVQLNQPKMFGESQSYSEMDYMQVYTYPQYKDDLCYELVPVSREQLAKEADEGIKQIDKEMK